MTKSAFTVGEGKVQNYRPQRNLSPVIKEPVHPSSSQERRGAQRKLGFQQPWWNEAEVSVQAGVIPGPTTSPWLDRNERDGQKLPREGYCLSPGKSYTSSKTEGAVSPNSHAEGEPGEPISEPQAAEPHM